MTQQRPHAFCHESIFIYGGPCSNVRCHLVFWRIALCVGPILLLHDRSQGLTTGSVQPQTRDNPPPPTPSNLQRPEPWRKARDYYNEPRILGAVHAIASCLSVSCSGDWSSQDVGTGRSNTTSATSTTKLLRTPYQATSEGVHC